MLKQSIFIATLIASMMGSNTVEGQEKLNLPRQTFQQYIELTKKLGQKIQIVVKRPEYDVPLDDKLLNHIWKLCERYDIEYELYLSLIKVESNFDSKVVSYNGSSAGIAQINKFNTAKWLAKEVNIKDFDIYNPYHNTHASIWYLNYLRQYWIDKGYKKDIAMRLGLIAYNKGLEGSKRHVRQYGFRSKYTNKIYENKTKIIKGEDIAK